MNWRKGTLQKLANPGSESTWATHSFAGNNPWRRPWRRAVGLQPRPHRPHQKRQPGGAAPALLMVTRVVGTGVTVRLLQDWGGVDRSGPG